VPEKEGTGDALLHPLLRTDPLAKADEGIGLVVSELATLGLLVTQEEIVAVLLSHTRAERDTVSEGDLDWVALEDDDRLGV
jgi:hypothetical protein